MKVKKSILITGGSGLLAVNWALSVRDKYKVTLLLHRRKISLHGVNTEVVLLDSLEECLFLLDKHQPDIVIHTAGLTSVEECELSPLLAQKINVDLARNMASACSKNDVKLVHISTDHLFDGKTIRHDTDYKISDFSAHFGEVQSYDGGAHRSISQKDSVRLSPDVKNAPCAFKKIIHKRL